MEIRVLPAGVEANDLPIRNSDPFPFIFEEKKTKQNKQQQEQLKYKRTTFFFLFLSLCDNGRCNQKENEPVEEEEIVQEECAVTENCVGDTDFGSPFKLEEEMLTSK